MTNLNFKEVIKQPKEKEYTVYLKGIGSFGDEAAETRKTYNEKEFLNILPELKKLNRILNEPKGLFRYLNSLSVNTKLNIPGTDDCYCEILTYLKIESLNVDGKIYDVNINDSYKQVLNDIIDNMDNDEFLLTVIRNEEMKNNEYIINPYKNVKSKKAYYDNAYDDDLVLKHAKHIKIVKAIKGNLDDIMDYIEDIEE